jgi:hypothetical protein
MTSRFQPRCLTLVLISLSIVLLTACTSETVEVTRIKIMERRVIERIPVTVEVTRIHRVTETPRPTERNVSSDGATPTIEATPSAPPPTDTAVPEPTEPAQATAVPSARQASESLLSALQGAEQSLLALIQALNSQPIPVDQAVGLYNSLSSAQAVAIPEEEGALQSIYIRYREQLDLVSSQGTDLYNHLVQIQAGEAVQTEVSPTHLSLAQGAVSAATSTIQGLIRELEAYLASQP